MLDVRPMQASRELIDDSNTLQQHHIKDENYQRITEGFPFRESVQGQVTTNSRPCSTPSSNASTTAESIKP
jgi:hypothetical protein